MSDIKNKVLSYMAQGDTLISGKESSPAWLFDKTTGKTTKVPDVTLRSLLKDKMIHIDYQTLTTTVYKLTPKGLKKVKEI